MPMCSVKECENEIRARGLCDRHWKRWRRHGDPTSGRVDTGEPHRYLADTVMTHSGSECLDWPFARDGHGYGRIRLDGKAKIVSRVVCEELNGPPPSLTHQVAHSCCRGQYGCVAPAHLRWATQTENEADKIAVYGARKKGIAA